MQLQTKVWHPVMCSQNKDVNRNHFARGTLDIYYATARIQKNFCFSSFLKWCGIMNHNIKGVTWQHRRNVKGIFRHFGKYFIHFLAFLSEIRRAWLFSKMPKISSGTSLSFYITTECFNVADHAVAPLWSVKLTFGRAFLLWFIFFAVNCTEPGCGSNG